MPVRSGGSYIADPVTGEETPVTPDLAPPPAEPAASDVVPPMPAVTAPASSPAGPAVRRAVAPASTTPE